MNLQGRNLSSEMRGSDVALLHTELTQIGYAITSEEIARTFFGSSTRDAVVQFQRRRGLTLTGVVDDTTARLINAEVGSAASGDLKVRGTIRSASGSPVAGATVRAPLLPRRGLPKLPRLDGNATTPRTSTRWRFLGLRTW